MVCGFHINEIQNDDQKSLYTREVLEKLPEWFGNKTALNEYVEKVRGLPYYAAINDVDKCIGFFSVKTHYHHTGDIFVCGVLPEYQRNGVGKKLYQVAEESSNCI